MTSDRRRGGSRDKAANNEPTYHERVAAKLIEQLQQGTAPWQKPWEPGQLRAPFNPTTNKPYRGFNTVWLMAQGHADPRWLTYNQADAIGAQVKKGEKGTVIQYAKFRGEEPMTDDAGKPIIGDDGKPKTQMVEYDRPRVFGAVVFNASQIDGMPPLEAKTTIGEWERHAQAEAIMKASGINIQHQRGDRAYYQVTSDKVVLPERAQFPTADRYYATALHELGHATGHPSRLNRDLANPFGSEAYAKEELRAEIASLMIGERLEIGHDPGQHAAYVGSWIKALKDDPREIMRAAADAEKISAYVVSWPQQQQQPTPDQLAASKSLQEREAQQLTHAEFAQQANVQPVDHRRGWKWNVVLPNRLTAFSNEETPEAAIKDVHRASVANAIFLNTQGSTILDVNPPMPPSHVLREYPDLAATIGAQLPVETEAKTMSQNDPSGKHYLAVPYAEKNEAKDAGARWDKDAKSWYAPPGADLDKLARWSLDKRPVAAPVQDDPLQEFGRALRDAGLQVEDHEVVMDGKRHRCKADGDKGAERSGSYRGFLDGHPAGHIQNFKTGLTQNWKSANTAPTLSDADRERQAAEAAVKQQQRAADLQAQHQRVSDRITKAIADPREYKPADPNHPYLRKKGLAGDAGDLLQDLRGNLVVPAKDADGKLWSLQWIGADGAKGFTKDSRIEATSHIANASKPDGPIFIGEGWATMDTIRRATGEMTVTAFNAGNLGHVAKIIREQHPDRPIVIAGDNDHQKEAQGKPNVGKEAAERVAKEVNGHAALPTFHKDSKGSDWNDFAKEHGTEALQKAMTESTLLADRRQLADAQMLGRDGERVEQTISQNQNNAERQLTRQPAAAAELKGAYADLRKKATKEADRQDRIAEGGEDQDRPRGAGRARSQRR